jgi:hypothetical protein
MGESDMGRAQGRRWCDAVEGGDMGGAWRAGAAAQGRAAAWGGGLQLRRLARRQFGA